MRFKDFINEDLTMQGTGQTAGITGGTQTANNQTGNNNMANPMMNNPAMQRIMKNLDVINKDAGQIPNPQNKSAVQNNVKDFKTMLQQGPNSTNQNKLTQRNMNNIKTGVNVPNRGNMANQPNIDPQLGNNGNNMNGGNVGN